MGLVVGSFGGIGGYSTEVRSQLWRLRSLLPAVVLGALAGTALLLALPAGVFTAAVPALIILACVLLLAQPQLVRLTRGRERHDNPWILRLLLIPVSAYGAYFGAGLGIMTLAVTGVFLDETLPRLNALKLVFAATTNSIAAVIFAFRAPVNWLDALLLAVGSTAGALGISPVAKRIPATPLRFAIAAIGITVAIRLALNL